MEEGTFKVVDGGKADPEPMIPGRRMVEEPHSTQFIGTPAEVEAVMRRFFSSMRMFIVGQTSEANDDGTLKRDDDGNLVPTDEQEGRLDAYDRTVWRIDITPLETVVKTPCRNAFLADAERIRTERELYELLGKGGLASDKG